MTVPKYLVQNGCFAADSVAMQYHATNADRTRAIVERTLEALEANGMIKFVPEDEWPDFFVPDPPYGFPFPSTGADK